MSSIHFLTTLEVVELHAAGIAEHGGSPALLDLGKLDSAVAQPRQAIGGHDLHPSIAAKAAAYLFYIAKVHAFEDGNKRVAARAALVFLDINGFRVLPGLELAEMVGGLVTGKHAREEAVEFFQSRMVSHQPDPPMPG